MSWYILSKFLEQTEMSVIIPKLYIACPSFLKVLLYVTIFTTPHKALVTIIVPMLSVGDEDHRSSGIVQSQA